MSSKHLLMNSESCSHHPNLSAVVRILQFLQFTQDHISFFIAGGLLFQLLTRSKRNKNFPPHLVAQQHDDYIALCILVDLC